MPNRPAEATGLPDWMQSWERFWFTPADPTLLGLIRILCGAMTVYIFVAYSFALQDMFGPNAWVDLQIRQEFIHDRPVSSSNFAGALAPIPARTLEQQNYLDTYRAQTGMDLRLFGLPPPENDAQWKYVIKYTRDWGKPPPAYATSERDAKMVDEHREKFGWDFRAGGLKPPADAWQWQYLLDYSNMWNGPPPAYAADQAEADRINDYIKREAVDPRTLYARGSPIFSIWMHITDPTGMAIVQVIFILFAVLFTLGLGTRVTSALTWFASLCFIHRNSQVLFGADTMMNVLLLYLMIGPCGAALSLDRWIARRWRGANAGPLPPPEPRVSANFAIRLLQIHVCIIYFISGLAKLQGNAWWTGNALWGVLANYEFAPMTSPLYLEMLRFLCQYQLRYEVAMTAGCYFTLAFEVSYIFLIWWRRTRWVLLAGAILLHGTIGIFMGLKTFSMLMLVMNLAFLRPEEVHWILSRLTRRGASPTAAPSAPVPAAAAPAVAAAKR